MGKAGGRARFNECKVLKSRVEPLFKIPFRQPQNSSARRWSQANQNPQHETLTTDRVKQKQALKFRRQERGRFGSF
jgi:hypothetical protein